MVDVATLDYRDHNDDRRDRRPVLRAIAIAWAVVTTLTFAAMVLVATGGRRGGAMAMVVVGLYLATLLSLLVYLVASGLLRSPRV